MLRSAALALLCVAALVAPAHADDRVARRHAALGEIGGEARDVRVLESAQEVDLSKVIDADGHGRTLACRGEEVHGVRRALGVS